VENTTTWTAIREDRALPAAHSGTTLRTLGTSECTKNRSLVAPMGSFAALASAYVAGQESNPPREESG
jgi:hypothetical protein